jgi:hypothetical protein
MIFNRLQSWILVGLGLICPDAAFSQTAQFGSTPLLPERNRTRVEITNWGPFPQMRPERHSPSCTLLGHRTQGTVVGRENGFDLVVFDYWDDRCQGGFNRRIGYIPSGSAKPVEGPAPTFPAGLAPDDVLRSPTLARDREQVNASTRPPSPAASATPCPDTLREKAAHEPLPEYVNEISGLMGFIINRTGGMKTDVEVDRYVACHLGGEQPYQDYNNRYRHLIRSASEAFGVPRGLLTCLLMRESQFDSRLVSETGARGLGQHTRVNIAHIREQLTKNGRDRESWEQYRALAGRSPAAPLRCPNQFSSEADAFCPDSSIGAAALYLREIQQALMRSSRVQNVQWENGLDLSLVMVAAYNMGSPTAASAVRNLHDIPDWVRAVQERPTRSEKRTEVMKHIRAIRNCMAHDVWRGLADRDPIRTRRQCEDRATQRARSNRSVSPSS